MQKALAIDVGGTKIYSAVIDENGEILTDIEKHQTPKTYEQIKRLFESIIKKYEDVIDIVAFSTCGAVNNTNDGIVGSTGNIAKEYPLMPFKTLSKKPVYVENDANCAAWAEYKIGASKGSKVSIMITLGTGVGGGIIINNQLLKGQNGAAGEMHFKMRTDKKRKCSCGSWDCFEIYASGTGLKITAQEITKNSDVTTYDVVEGVKSGDEIMLNVFDKWQNDIIDGIVGLANLFDPDCVVLSGSMAEFVDIEKVEKSVNEQIVTTSVKIKKAQAGNYAGMIGAALLGLNR